MQLQKLHHVAYRCVDAKETADFYTGLLDVKLAHTIVQDRVPSTGELSPHSHVFFEMADGSFIAFFDVADETTVAQQSVRDWAQHLALEVAGMDELAAAKGRLTGAGVDVLGPVDHGFCQSIYFFDPSGHRLELTARTEAPGELDGYHAEAWAALDAWSARKAAHLRAASS